MTGFSPDSPSSLFSSSAVGTISLGCLADNMGTMAEGSVTVGGQKVNCKGDFGSDRVLFSGGRRGEVPY